MASGTITLKRTGTGFLDGKIVWSSVSNGSSANTSTVTAHLQIRRNSTTSNTQGTFTGTFTASSTQKSISKWLDLGYEYVTIETIQVVVSHDASGAGECYLHAKVNGPSGTSMASTYVEGSQTVTLDTIPREATIISAPDFTDLGNPTITYSNPAGNAVTSLEACISFTGEWDDIAYRDISKTGNSYTFNLTEEERDVLRNNTPGTERTVIFYVRTYIGSTRFLSTLTKKLTIVDSEATRPTVSMRLSPVSALSPPFDSLYIQGKSKVKADLAIETKYGASVDASSITVAGVAYPDPYESNYLTQIGALSVRGQVKDSRGFYGTIYEDINVIPYNAPNVQAASGESNIVAARCDVNGKQCDDGTYLKIKAKLIYEKVISEGVQNNFGKIQYRYRAEGGLWSGWYPILDSASTTDTEVTTGALLDGALSIKTNYQVQIQAVDDIEESQPVTLIIPSDEVYMDRPAGGRSMGLGGYSSGNGSLDIYWKTKARGGLSLFNEVGEELNLDSILPIPRGQLGEGWNPNDIANGVYEVSAYPLKDSMGNVLMETGALIQLAVTTDGFVKLQMAFPTDTFTPVYRLKWYTNWSDWLSFKI